MKYHFFLLILSLSLPPSKGYAQQSSFKNIQYNYTSAFIGNNIGVELEFQKKMHFNKIGFLFQINKEVPPNVLAFYKAQHSNNILDHFGLGYAYGYKIITHQSLDIYAYWNNQLFYTKFYQEGFVPYGTVALDSTNERYLLSVLIPFTYDNMLSLQSYLGLRTDYRVNQRWSATVGALIFGTDLIYQHRNTAEFDLEVDARIRPQLQVGIAYQLKPK